MPDISLFILSLNVLATGVMAASASIQAVRQDFDPVGAIFLSVVTAVGGGTLRDLMIGASPVFWLTDPTYISTAVPVGLATYYLANRMEGGAGQRRKLLAYLDAIGLALFTLVGLRVALGHGIAPPFAVILGCITGIGGGIFRDVLSGLTPIVLRKDIYATLSLAGGALYILLLPHVRAEISLTVAFLSIAIARVIVVWRSPVESASTKSA